MDKWYWDTSAVLKLYCSENDSLAYIDYFAQVEGYFMSSQFLEVELFYAFQQKVHRRELTQNKATELFQQFIEDKAAGHFELISLSQSIVDRSHELWGFCQKHDPALTLRSLDGVHLATAIDAGCQHLITADQRMQLIGRDLGLSIPEVCQPTLGTTGQMLLHE